MRESETDYLRRRIDEERALADQASDPTVAQTHADLADAYEAKIAERAQLTPSERAEQRDLPPPPPTWQMAASNS